MLEMREWRVVARGRRYVKYVEIVPPEDATGLVAAVYEQIARNKQVLPPAVLHSSAPELLAGAWCMLRETLLVGEVPRLRAEILGTAVTFHYFNRMASVFLESVPISLPASVSAHPGDSLALLAPAALPEDLRWSEPATVIASAFARMARVVDSAALELIPADVRTVVANRIARWNGEGVRLDLGWIENTTRILHSMDRPLAALLLLTALGPHQVDSRLVSAVRKGCPDPHDWSRYLVSVVAWAAFTAARRVGTCIEATLRDRASCCGSVIGESKRVPRDATSEAPTAG
jgi:hypothetical protein